jgi:hypothetical protein
MLACSLTASISDGIVAMQCKTLTPTVGHVKLTFYADEGKFRKRKSINKNLMVATKPNF